MTDEEFSGILENFFRKGATWTLYRAYRALSDSVALLLKRLLKFVESTCTLSSMSPVRQ